MDIRLFYGICRNAINLLKAIRLLYEYSQFQAKKFPIAETSSFTTTKGLLSSDIIFDIDSQ